MWPPQLGQRTRRRSIAPRCLIHFLQAMWMWTSSLYPLCAMVRFPKFLVLSLGDTVTLMYYTIPQTQVELLVSRFAAQYYFWFVFNRIHAVWTIGIEITNLALKIWSLIGISVESTGTAWPTLVQKPLIQSRLYQSIPKRRNYPFKWSPESFQRRSNIRLAFGVLKYFRSIFNTMAVTKLFNNPANLSLKTQLNSLFVEDRHDHIILVNVPIDYFNFLPAFVDRLLPSQRVLFREGLTSELRPLVKQCFTEQSNVTTDLLVQADPLGSESRINENFVQSVRCTVCSGEKMYGN